jgi:hypothetical protein
MEVLQILGRAGYSRDRSDRIAFCHLRSATGRTNAMEIRVRNFSIVVMGIGGGAVKPLGFGGPTEILGTWDK